MCASKLNKKSLKELTAIYNDKSGKSITLLKCSKTKAVEKIMDLEPSTMPGKKMERLILNDSFNRAQQAYDRMECPDYYTDDLVEPLSDYLSDPCAECCGPGPDCTCKDVCEFHDWIHKDTEKEEISYIGIRLWCKKLGSMTHYTEALVKHAVTSNAPKDAIYWEEPGRWVLVGELSEKHPVRLAYINFNS